MGGTTRRWGLAACLVLGGCLRLATPATQGEDGLGAPCSDAADCASGVCQQGVCCESLCSEGESCNLPRAPGHCRPLQVGDRCTERCLSGDCVDGWCCAGACDSQDPTRTCGMPDALGECHPRTLGDPCSADAECPTGVCEDGVCCEGRCGECARCDLTGARRGSCAFLASNTDPDHDCSPAEAPGCLACFSGLCLPATPGTDPAAHCPLDQACNAHGDCGLLSGAACTVDTDCARGACLAQACTTVELSLLQLPALPAAEWRRERRVLQLAITGGGDALAIVENRDFSDDTTVSITTMVTRYSAATARWDGINLPLRGPVAGVAALGEYGYVLVGTNQYTPAEAQTEPACAYTNTLGVGYCDFTGFILDTAGRVVTVDTDVKALQPQDRQLCGIKLTEVEDHTLLAALALAPPDRSCFGQDPYGVFLLQRAYPSGTWTRVGDSVTEQTGVLLGVGGTKSTRYVLQTREDTGAGELLTVDDQGVVIEPAPAGPCGQARAAAGWMSPDGSMALLGGYERGGDQGCLASWDVSRPLNDRWRSYSVGTSPGVAPLRVRGTAVLALDASPSRSIFRLISVPLDGSAPVDRRPILEEVSGAAFTHPTVSSQGPTAFAYSVSTFAVRWDPINELSSYVQNVDTPMLVFLR